MDLLRLVAMLTWLPLLLLIEFFEVGIVGLGEFLLQVSHVFDMVLPDHDPLTV